MMTHRRRVTFWSILTGLLIGVPATALGAQDLAVVNARLVAESEGGVTAPVTIVISGGRIAAIDSGGTAVDATVARVDAEGLFVVPGRVERLAADPDWTSLAWREEMLVRLSEGVTTLVLPAGRIAGVRDLIPGDLPIPHLAAERPVDANTEPDPGGSGLEVGAAAGFLVVEEAPSVAGPEARPLALVVGGRVYSREQLALEARVLAGKHQRMMLYGDMPRVHEGPPWPVTCEPEFDDACLGPGPDCALMHHLIWRAWGAGEGDCLAPKAGALRRRLLTSLDRLAAVAPSDAWIVGQRVNLALIEGAFDRALEVAEGCAAEAWWCDALRGLVLHTRSPGSGGPAFEAALASVPDDAPAWRDPPLEVAGDRGVGCEWRDIAYLIEDPELGAEYASRPCGGWNDFEDRFWWLADPLWSEPGNPRRDEHVARNVRAKLRDEVLRIVSDPGRWIHGHCEVSPEQWPNDHQPAGEVRCRSSHADWVRFGAPDSWRGIPYTSAIGFRYGPDGKFIPPEFEECQKIGINVMCGTSSSSPGQRREGYLSGGYSFVPGASAYAAPERSTPSDWEVERGVGHERMKTDATWHNLDEQTAVLLRGDSVRVLSAGSFPTLLASLDELEGVLALGRVSDHEVRLYPAEVERGSGVLRAEARVEADAWVASLEASGPGVVGRSRQGAPLPELSGGFGISKPVLVRADFDPAHDDLLGAMIPSRTFPMGGSAGLYVELYGIEAGQQVRMRLSYEVEEVRRSWFGRIASALGLGGDPSGPVTVEWTEQLEVVEDGVGSVFIATRLADLPKGDLELSIAALQGDRTARTTTNLKSR